MFEFNGDYIQINTVSTTESTFTVPNLDAGRVIVAFYSFSASAEVKATAIVLTPLFLKGTNDYVELRDNPNNQTGYITRKSSSTIGLRTSDSRWQITCWIY